jgi:hypothetical protein
MCFAKLQFKMTKIMLLTTEASKSHGCKIRASIRTKGKVKLTPSTG